MPRLRVGSKSTGGGKGGGASAASSSSAGYFGVALAQQLAADRLAHAEQDLRVPYLVKVAVAAIVRTGLDQEGITRISGDQAVVRRLRAQVDAGECPDFARQKTGTHDVASLLKMYLRELPECLLLPSLYGEWLAAVKKQGAGQRCAAFALLLGKLPHENRALLAELLPMCRLIADNSHVSRMNVENISRTIGPNLLWRPGGEADALALLDSTQVNLVAQTLIEHVDALFPPVLGPGVPAKMRFKLYGHERSVKSLVAARPGEVWSCDSAGAVHVWDAAAHKVSAQLETRQGRLFAMVSLGAARVATTSQDACVVWDCNTRAPVHEIRGFAYTALATGSEVWIAAEGALLRHDAGTLAPAGTVDVGKPGAVVTCLEYDSAARRVWGGATDNTLRVWDAQTGALLHTHHDFTGKVNALARSHGRLWAAEDGIIVYDLASCAKVRRLDDGAHKGAIHCVCAFGGLVWSGGWDTNVVLWDADTLVPVHRLDPLFNDTVAALLPVHNAASDEVEAWTGSWDKSVGIFQIAEGAQRAFLQEDEQQQLQMSAAAAAAAAAAAGLKAQVVGDGAEDAKAAALVSPEPATANATATTTVTAPDKVLGEAAGENELAERRARLVERHHEILRRQSALASLESAIAARESEVAALRERMVRNR